MNNLNNELNNELIRNMYYDDVDKQIFENSNVDKQIFENSNITMFFNNITETEKPIVKFQSVMVEYDKIKPIECGTDTQALSAKVEEQTVELKTHNVHTNGKMSDVTGLINLYRNNLLNIDILPSVYKMGVDHFNNSNIIDVNLVTKIKFKDKPFKWIYNLFKSEYKIYSEQQYLDILDKLVNKIHILSYTIATDSRKGKATNIMVNNRLSQMLQDHRDFVFNGDCKLIEGPIYKAGTINGLALYVNLNLDINDNKLLLWRTDEDETCGLQLFYKPGIEIFCSDQIDFKETSYNYVKTYAIVESNSNTKNAFLTVDINIPVEKTFKERLKTFLHLK